MTNAEATVFIVDDDEAICQFLTKLLSSSGFEAQAFTSVEAFLRRLDHERPGCVLLDIRMPDKSGLELQAELVERSINLPIIFNTGHRKTFRKSKPNNAGPRWSCHERC
jgi:two-component system response regulator FixJ